MKLFGSIVVLSIFSVMVSSADPTGHTTGRSRVRARNLNNVPTGHTTGRSRVRARNLSEPTGHTTGRSRVRSRNLRGTKNDSDCEEYIY